MTKVRWLAWLCVPALIVVLALAMRLTMLERYLPVSPWVAAQTLGDAEMGRNLLEGRGWSANGTLIDRATVAQSQPGLHAMVDLQDLLPVDDLDPASRASVGSAHTPGYSTWFAVSYWLGGEYRYVYSQRMQAVLDALGALLVFLIGARCWSRAAGVVGGVLYALSPPHAFLGNLTVAAATDSFWFLLSAYGAVVTAGAVMQGRQPWRGGALVAIAAFCGACMNSTPLVLPTATAGVAILIALVDRRYLRVAAALVLAQVLVLAVLTPWALRNQRLFDQFSLVRGSFWQLAFAAWGELPNPWGLGFDDKEYWHWVDENCPGCSAGTQQQAMRDFLISEVVTSRPFPRHIVNLLALRLPRAIDVASTPDGVFSTGKTDWVARALARLFSAWNRGLTSLAWLAALGLGLALLRPDRRALVVLGLAPTLFLTIFSLLFYVELRKTVPGYGYVLVLIGIAVAAVLEWAWSQASRLTGGRVAAATVAIACLIIQPGIRAQAPSPVAGGELHSAIVNSAGDVWGWGNDLYGQLGDGSRTGRYAASPKAQGIGVRGAAGVAAGSNHTLAITQDGSAWCWGDNSMGQLGIGSRVSQLRPVLVPSLPAIRAIRGGYAHSLALDADGKVWAWGSNLYGQLGQAAIAEALTPVRVPVPQKVVAIAAGWFFSLAVDDTGRVWAWGRNTRGQLGWPTESDVREPAKIPGLTDIQMVAAGHQHALALAHDGRVWAWGANDYGQLGVPRPEDVASLERAFDLLGAVRASDAARQPPSMGATRSATRRAVLPPRVITHLPTPVELVAGADSTFAVTAAGQAWAWGDNLYGQLGNGGWVTRSEPAPVLGLPPIARLGAGHAHLAAIARDGAMWTWGFGHYGQLGDGLTERRLPVPRKVMNLRAREPALDLSPVNALVLGPAEVGWTEPGVLIEGRRLIVKNTAAGQYSYAALAKPVRVGPEAALRHLFVQGTVRKGAITVGVQQDERWVFQANVDSPGPFTVLWDVPTGMNAVAVIAHHLPADDLSSDVEITAWGWLKSLPGAPK